MNAMRIKSLKDFIFSPELLNLPFLCQLNLSLAGAYISICACSPAFFSVLPPVCRYSYWSILYRLGCAQKGFIYADPVSLYLEICLGAADGPFHAKAA